MNPKISKGKEKLSKASKRISLDQPFDYEEVVAATGEEYVRNLYRDGVAFIPYEEVKRRLPGFYPAEDKCVWMKAGIINFRLCDSQYSCDDCEFDKSMRSAMGEKASSKTRKRVGVVMYPCIHFLRGAVEAPVECSGNYECYHCAVHEKHGKKRQPAPTALGEPPYVAASGYRVADPYYYHFGHTWVHIVHGECVRIGMDDFAARVFGRAGKIKLPQIGEALRQGHTGWSIERNGHRAFIQSPLTGKVLAVNRAAAENPSISHDDPYHKGWLLHLEPWLLKREINGLYFGEDCTGWLEKENTLLLNMLGPEYERLAATGGETLDDFFGSFPEIGWDRLVRTFLLRGKKT